MKNDSRRDFLRKSLIGISGAALAPGILDKATAAAGTISTPYIINADELPARTLGKTGLNVPLISMGVEGANNAGSVQFSVNKTWMFQQ